MIFRVALGALAMYYLDPVSGNRRRAVLRDKLTHYRHEASHMARGTLKHTRNKARGISHDLSGNVKESEPAPQRWPVDVELKP